MEWNAKISLKDLNVDCRKVNVGLSLKHYGLSEVIILIFRT